MDTMPGRITATFAYHQRTDTPGKVKTSTMPLHLLTGSEQEVRELKPVLIDQFGPGEIIFTDDPEQAIAQLEEYVSGDYIPGV